MKPGFITGGRGALARSAVAAAVALLAAAAPADATVTFIGSQTAFTAATSEPAIDTFDDLGYGFIAASLNRTVEGYGYTVSARRGLDGDSNNPDQWLTVDNDGDALTFKAFSGGVVAVGGSFFGTTASGSYIAADIVVTATDDDGSVTMTLAKPAVGDFAGFVSTKSITQMTSKAVQPIGATAWVGANNFVLASAVAHSPSPLPEPSTWATMLLGFGAVGAGLRRTRQIVMV